MPRPNWRGKIEIDKMIKDPSYIPEWKTGNLTLDPELIEEMYFLESDNETSSTVCIPGLDWIHPIFFHDQCFNFGAGGVQLNKAAERANWAYWSIIYGLWFTGPNDLAKFLEETVLAELYYHFYHTFDYLNYALFHDWGKDIANYIADSRQTQEFWELFPPPPTEQELREQDLARQDQWDWEQGLPDPGGEWLPGYPLNKTRPWFPLYVHWTKRPVTSTEEESRKTRREEFLREMEGTIMLGKLARYRSVHKRTYVAGKTWKSVLFRGRDEETKRNADALRVMRKRGKKVYIEKGWIGEVFKSWLKFRDDDGKWKIVVPSLELTMKAQLSKKFQKRFKKKYISTVTINLNRRSY